MKEWRKCSARPNQEFYRTAKIWNLSSTELILLFKVARKLLSNTRNPLPSAATCEASGAKLASLAAPPRRSLRSPIPLTARFARQTPSTWPPRTPKKTSRPSGKTSASDGLGGRIWGHPVPLNRGRWATFDSWHNPEKCLLLWFFDTQNSANQLTASEAAEASLDRPKTSARMSKGCMQSFDLLALKLRPWWGNTAMDRHNFWVFLYIVRYANKMFFFVFFWFLFAFFVYGFFDVFLYDKWCYLQEFNIVMLLKDWSLLSGPDLS